MTKNVNRTALFIQPPLKKCSVGSNPSLYVWAKLYVRNLLQVYGEGKGRDETCTHQKTNLITFVDFSSESAFVSEQPSSRTMGRMINILLQISINYNIYLSIWLSRIDFCKIAKRTAVWKRDISVWMEERYSRW